MGKPPDVELLMRRFLIGLVLLTAADAASACPMCKDSVPNKEGTAITRDSYTSNGENISSGINASVYVMLGALFGVMGVVGAVIVKGVRSADAGRATAPRPTEPDPTRD